MSNLDNTLAERGNRYGVFTGHAEITQSFKDTMQNAPQWLMLEDDQKEALEMVAHKIARILNGDPNYIDSWTDIIGYTRLVEKRLMDEQAVVHKFAFKGEVGGQMEAKTDGAAPAPVAPEKNADESCNCPARELNKVLTSIFGEPRHAAPEGTMKVVNLSDFLANAKRFGT